MTMLRWAIGLLLFTAACQVPLKGAACPCASGWICCEGGDICVQKGELCPATSDGGESCIAGVSCPGDPLPGDAVGTIHMGIANFPSGVVKAGGAIVVSFPIIVTTLNRATSFPVLTAAFLDGDQTVRLATTALDEHDQPVTSIVLPATTTRLTRTLKVRIAIPDSAPHVPAYVVLGLGTAVKSGGHRVGYAPSSGRVAFTVGEAAPPPNPFSVSVTYLNTDLNATYELNPEYAIIDAPRVTDFYAATFLVDFPTGSKLASVDGVFADGSWQVGFASQYADNVTVNLDSVRPWDIKMPPPATTLTLNFHTDAGQTATVRYGFFQP